MEDLIEYDSLAQTIQTSEITTNERNAGIINRIRNQDPDFTKLTLFYTNENKDNYQPINGREFVWLGYFIGSNTQLQDLNIADNIQGVVSITSEQIKLFLEGVNKNKSTKKLKLNSFDGEFFHVDDLKPLVKDNTNLETLVLHRCVLDHQAISLLPLARTLKAVHFDEIQMTGETLPRTLDALGMLPRLQKLILTITNIGVNECRQIAAFLGRDSTNLIDLDLGSNFIDDEAVEVLVLAISRYNKNLQVFNLSNNIWISARGQRAVSNLLKSPNCTLKRLDLGGHMDDEGAQLFADALANNKSLVYLGLDNNDISATGWAAFSRLLCDTSSVNKTFLSNHTLRTLSHHRYVSNMNMTRDGELATILYINGLSDSRHQSAVLNILRSHPDINMQPLFEWDFKLMPYVVDWLVEAGDHTSRFSARISRMKIRRDNDASIETVNLRTSEAVYLHTRLEALAQQFQQDLPKRKLTALYQFIKGMPELYIGSRLLAVLHRTRTTRNRLQHELEENDLQEQECLRALKSRRLNSE